MNLRASFACSRALLGASICSSDAPAVEPELWNDHFARSPWPKWKHSGGTARNRAGATFCHPEEVQGCTLVRDDSI